MNKIRLLLACILVLHMNFSYAQFKVSGKVKDNNGPLPLVSIYEKGLPNNGTVADNDGLFSLVLKGTSKTIVLSRVGYLLQEIKINPKSPAVEIVMQANDQDLNQVIVVGYGTKKNIFFI